MNALVLSDYVPREWAERAHARAELAEAGQRQAHRDADAAWESATRHAFMDTVSVLDTPALRVMFTGHLSSRLMSTATAEIVAERLSRIELLNALTDIFMFITTEHL